MHTKLKSYLQLVRLPNAFTALADVAAGFLACGGGAGGVGSLLAIGGVSACLYSGGIALNDVCDVEVDRRERPSRPLPSGRIRWAQARAMAVVLLAGGLALAALVNTASVAMAALLVVSIVAYDMWAKSHPLRGPLLMGACRFTNVVLGGTAASSGQFPPWIPALLIGCLVIAATILSRNEVEGGKRGSVLGASGVVIVIAMLAGFWLGAPGRDPWGWLFLCVFLAFTGPGLVQAWQTPTPQAIQNGVKYIVLGIIPLDAVVATGAGGLVAGCCVLGLLLPSWKIARWIYVT
jgi:4-hydroxybenzoate polyprenyltransferase